MAAARSPGAVGSSGRTRIEKVTTSGKFTLDGQTFPVENNVWLVGDDNRVLVIDAAHDADAIDAAVGSRRLVAVVSTHGHNDHINAAVSLSQRHDDAPVLMHVDDLLLWSQQHPHRAPDGPLLDGQELPAADVTLTVLHTPGHSPGGVCLYARELGCVFSGDTLFKGGPGATGRSFSDFPTILTSIRKRLLTLPADTVVHPGHGEDTTIGAEAGDYDAWVARGH